MSYKPWIAILKGGQMVRWSGAPPHIDGHETLAARALLRLNEQGTIALTPVGPVVDLDPADPRAALAVLREIDPKLIVTRDAPKTATVPPGAVS